MIYQEMIEDIFSNIQEKENETIEDIIKSISPGTELRKGLDEILSGSLGALIVLGTNIVLESIIRGGFKLDIKFTPQRLFELSKMDGAIILSKDLKKIVYANVHLMPDNKITSNETGIRHRSAEQTAKQTNLPVIAISQRRKKITLFYKDQKYVLQDLNLLLTKANHSLKTLQSYRLNIDNALNELTYNEFNNTATLEDVIKIIQNITYLFIHKKQLQKIILELGIEGIEIKQSMYEQLYGLEDILKLLIMDYTNNKNINQTIKKLKNLDLKDLTDMKKVANIIGIEKNTILDEPITSKGYRILSKIPKISKMVIEKVIDKKENIINILNSDPKELSKEVEINEKQAKLMVNRLQKIYELVINKI